MSGYYGIPGGTLDSNDVKSVIEWLVTASNFTCGGLDPLVRAFITLHYGSNVGHYLGESC